MMSTIKKYHHRICKAWMLASNILMPYMTISSLVEATLTFKVITPLQK